MGTPLASTIRFEFVVDTPDLAADTFMVIDFKGEEGLSRPFHFELNLISYKPDLSLDSVANKPATLEVYRDDQQMIFHGQVAHFEQGPFVADRYHYRAVVVPPLWFLSLSTQTRIFRDKNAGEIVEEVLQEAGFTSQHYTMEASGTLREYCVQYNETDLAFISRLLEYDGIRYYFDEGKVVFTEAVQSPPLPGNIELEFNPGGGMEAAAQAVRTFTTQERVVTGSVRLHDYNYEQSTTSLLVEKPNAEEPGLLYEYGPHHKDGSQGTTLADIRREEIVCQRRVMHGESGYVGMRAGFKFALVRHYRPELDQDYLLTAVTHQGQQGASVPGLMGEQAQQETSYRNTFQSIPANIPYRPPRVTPVPRVPGVMTGRIEKPGGDYAHLDEQGRYRARMHFDVGDAQVAEATHDIRMAQPYSGPGYGIHFPNHADTEMVWACVNGDPNRPMALGTAPNDQQTSPVTSANKHQNVIKTFSGNQMIMDDMRDEEQILISTPAINSLLFDDKDDRIFLTTTDKHQALFDDKNKQIVIQTTDGHFLKLDDGGKRVTLQSKNGHFLSINDNSGEEKITIIDADGANTVTIDISNKKIVVKTNQGDIDIHAPQGLIDVQAAELNVETTGDMTFKAGGNISMEATGNLDQKATNITSEASMDHKSSGLNVTSEAGLMHQVKGTTSKMEGATLAQIQGLLVKIN